jgi:hypothetical protein
MCYGCASDFGTSRRTAWASESCGPAPAAPKCICGAALLAASRGLKDLHPRRECFMQRRSDAAALLGRTPKRESGPSYISVAKQKESHSFLLNFVTQLVGSQVRIRGTAKRLVLETLMRNR